jgi:hypothetical protein
MKKKIKKGDKTETTERSLKKKGDKEDRNKKKEWIEEELQQSETDTHSLSSATAVFS